MNAPTLATLLFGLGWMIPSVPLEPELVEASNAQEVEVDLGSAILSPVPERRRPPQGLDHTIRTVEGMVWNENAQRMVQRHGLSLVNVTWEDTGRSKGSSVGPNISDMTIGVRDQQGALHPMPVIRFDNFNDKTADVKADKFWVLSGNAKGEELAPTRLSDLLSDVRSHLHDPRSWKGKHESLSNSRDSHVLVSAQAALLPVPKSGEATFTPVIYNYQSSPGNPAVLTMVATREGTSIQVVENDEGYMSEPLFFNADGKRAPFTATRLSDFKAQGGDATTPGDAVTQDAGLDTVLIIQVPLKHTSPRFQGYGDLFNEDYDMAPSMAAESTRSIEQAVIGHGAVEGPFTEINNLSIERDPRFPVRVTVQLYKATTSGTVTDADVADIRAQIDRIYSEGDYVGSLVTGGMTERPTEWVHPQRPHATWARPWTSWHKAR